MIERVLRRLLSRTRVGRSILLDEFLAGVESGRSVARLSADIAAARPATVDEARDRIRRGMQ